MLKRTTPKTINATLTVTGQGETVTLDVTFNNLAKQAYADLIEKTVERVQANVEGKRQDELVAETNAYIVIGLVSNWESEYELKIDDLLEAERDRPGLLLGVIRGFHQAREVAVAKN